MSTAATHYSVKPNAQMLRHLFVCLMVMMAFFSSFDAQGKAASQVPQHKTLPAQPSYKEPVQPPFYQAQKDGMVVYILGTSTSALSEDYPLSDKVMNALAASQLVTTSEIDDPAGQIPDDFFICQDACLRQYLSEAQWNSLVRQTRSDEEPVVTAILERMSPVSFVVWASLRNSREAGLSSDHGTVTWLVKQNQASQRKTIGLTTLAEEANTYSQLSERAKRELVQSTLRELEQPKTERIRDTRRDYQLWRQGDADTTFKTYQAFLKRTDDPAAMAELDQAVRISSNQRYVQRLLPLLSSDKPMFLAIAAVSLPGDQGILQLLKAQGFSIFRL